RVQRTGRVWHVVDGFLSPFVIKAIIVHDEVLLRAIWVYVITDTHYVTVDHSHPAKLVVASVRGVLDRDATPFCAVPLEDQQMVRVVGAVLVLANRPHLVRRIAVYGDEVVAVHANVRARDDAP